MYFEHIFVTKKSRNWDATFNQGIRDWRKRPGSLDSESRDCSCYVPLQMNVNRTNRRHPSVDVDAITAKCPLIAMTPVLSLLQALQCTLVHWPSYRRCGRLNRTELQSVRWVNRCVQCIKHSA